MPTAVGRVAEFRTFCHISEYDAWGYANLHRMIAMSEPLYLWAPSTQMLNSKGSRVSEKAFVRLVEAGRVRIIAREAWWDRGRRDQHPWEGAHWNPGVDSVLKAIMESDASEPAEKRRVLVAEDERGARDAEAYIARNPDVVPALHAVLTSSAAATQIPQGIRDAAARFPDDREKAVAAVLRDEFNHADAIGMVAPRAPFLFDDRESQFLTFLQDAMAGAIERDQAPAQTLLKPQERASSEPLGSSELTREVAGVLAALERQSRPIPVSTFLKSRGHGDLTRWLDDQCRLAADARDGYEPGGAAHVLRKQVVEGRFVGATRRVSDPENLVPAAILAVSELSLLTEPSGPLAELAIGLSAIWLIRGDLQDSRVLPMRYEGIQWPYFYSFGRMGPWSPATRRRKPLMERALDRLVPDPE